MAMSDEYTTACALLILIGLLLLCVGVGLRWGAWVGACLAGGVLLAIGVGAYLTGRGGEDGQ